jgi:hypothetical protein
MLTKTVWACKVRRAICVSSRRQCGSVGVLGVPEPGWANHKYITYVNLEQLQELVAFAKRSTYVKEGGITAGISDRQRSTAARRGSCRAVPSVSLVHTEAPNHQTTPVQSSLTSRQRTGALPHRARTHRVRWTCGPLDLWTLTAAKTTTTEHHHAPRGHLRCLSASATHT